MKPIDLAEAITSAKAPPAGLPAGLLSAGLIYGVVVSAQVGPPATLTVTLAGSSTNVAGIRYLRSYLPVAGDTVMIAQVGSDLVVIDALASKAGPYNPYMAHVTQAGTQADSSGADVVLTLDTKQYDPSTSFNTTTHLFTCPVAGVYLVTANFNSPNNTTGDRYAVLQINGAGGQFLGRNAAPTASGNNRVGGSDTYAAAAGTTLGIRFNTPGATAGAVSGGQASFTLISNAAP